MLQEVFAAAFNAICADDRPINARPWLYRIARNRCLNHLRRPQPSGQDSMDVFERDGGLSTADTVHKREEFRHIVADVQELPETQRTALLLREIDALSYEQIAEAMDTTVPSVKSLLVRARVALAEAAEARLLTCDEVRLELGRVAEGIARTLAAGPPPPQDVRPLPHLPRASCAGPTRRWPRSTRSDRCCCSRSSGSRSSASARARCRRGAATSSGGAAAGVGVAGATAAAAGGITAGGITAGGAFSAGISTVASKAAAGMAAAVIVTAGAVEVKHVAQPQGRAGAAQVAVAPAPAPAVPAPAPPSRAAEEARQGRQGRRQAEARAGAGRSPCPAGRGRRSAGPGPGVPRAGRASRCRRTGSTVVLPPREDQDPAVAPPAEEPTDPHDAARTTTTPTPAAAGPPAPPAGEPGSGQTPPPPRRRCPSGRAGASLPARDRLRRLPQGRHPRWADRARRGVPRGAQAGLEADARLRTRARRAQVLRADHQLHARGAGGQPRRGGRELPAAPDRAGAGRRCWCWACPTRRAA